MLSCQSSVEFKNEEYILVNLSIILTQQYFLKKKNILYWINKSNNTHCISIVNSQYSANVYIIRIVEAALRLFCTRQNFPSLRIDSQYVHIESMRRLNFPRAAQFFFAFFPPISSSKRNIAYSFVSMSLVLVDCGRNCALSACVSLQYG